jgi:hypothetical protein
VTDVVIHFRGVGHQRQRLAAVPQPGSYLFGPGDCRRLWVVSAVVFDAAVEVFTLEVSPRLAGELTAAWAAWAAWGEPIAAADDAPRQRGRPVGAGA